MTDDEDIDMLAAEYVVGALEPEEREAVAVRRVREPALDQAITAWEDRLAPWLDDYAPETPPQELKAKVLARIAETKAQSAPVSAAEVGDVSTLRRQLTSWKAAAAVGYALAAGLAALAFFTPPQSRQTDRFVAVFQNDDAQPAFIMSIDLATREIVIRPVAAKPSDGRTYQLWIASDLLGGAPRSLGLLHDGSKPVRKTLPYDAELLQKATFGISLEPEGGSPIGRPTGPAIHGRLIPNDL